MIRLIGLALLAGAVTLAGCGSANQLQPEDSDAALDAGTGSADMSATLEGSGDLSSAAGGGADTAAMDGGRAGDDGAPPVGEGEGGPSDALNGSSTPEPR